MDPQSAAHPRRPGDTRPTPAAALSRLALACWLVGPPCADGLAWAGPPRDGAPAVQGESAADVSAAPGTARAGAGGEGASPPAVPSLMLAQPWETGLDPSGFWVSEKLDGVRAYWDGARLVSRGGQAIAAPEWFTRGFPSVPLDGELWMGRGRFETLSGTVRRREPDPDAWRQVRYRVFDLPGSPEPFGRRRTALRALVAGASVAWLDPESPDRDAPGLEPGPERYPPEPYLELVEHWQVADAAELAARLAAVVRAGGEGLMLARDAGLYRGGRSGDLFKLKPYQDAEARVVAHLPGRGKYTGMLGALLVEDAEGRRFGLGTGLSDAERRDPPPVGSLVTYRFRGRTTRGLPRFASFLRVRDDY